MEVIDRLFWSIRQRVFKLKFCPDAKNHILLRFDGQRQAQLLYCVDSSTGHQHYVKRLGTECWGTPIVAGEQIYFFGKNGKTQVVRVGAVYEVTSTNQLWDEAAPPKPETYVEHVGGGHGHSGPPTRAAGNQNDKQPSDAQPVDAPSGGRRRGPGGGKLAAMMAGNKDSDGNLSAEEISVDFKPMLARIPI